MALLILSIARRLADALVSPLLFASHVPFEIQHEYVADTLNVMNNAGIEGHFDSFLAMVALGLILMISVSCAFSCCAASAFNPDPKPLFPGSIDKSMTCCSSCAESTLFATTPLISALVVLIALVALWKDAIKAVVAGGALKLCAAFGETATRFEAIRVGGGGGCDLPAEVVIGGVCTAVAAAEIAGFGDMSAKNKPAYTGSVIMAVLPVIAAAYQLFTYIRLKSARDLARGGAAAQQQFFFGMGSGPAPWMGTQTHPGVPPANWAGGYTSSTPQMHAPSGQAPAGMHPGAPYTSAAQQPTQQQYHSKAQATDVKNPVAEMTSVSTAGKV